MQRKSALIEYRERFRYEFIFIYNNGEAICIQFFDSLLVTLSSASFVFITDSVGGSPQYTEAIHYDNMFFLFPADYSLRNRHCSMGSV